MIALDALGFIVCLGLGPLFWSRLWLFVILAAQVLRRRGR